MFNALIVDDNFPNRQLLIEILRGHGECDPAENGKEAVDKFKASLDGKKFDVVLLDIAMPEVSGLDALKGIREIEKAMGIPKEKMVPVIMVTAFKEPFVEAFNLGCDDYVVKPVDPVELLALIKRKLQPR
jgi:two-component system chemotaxis response regulator CheY